MDWYTAVQVSVANGSNIVRVVSGESIAYVNDHDSLLIGSFTGRDILTAYVEEGTNDEIIELVHPWDEVDQVLQPARVEPTAVNFNTSVDVLKSVNESIFNRLSSYILFGEQSSGTVTFEAIGVGNTDVTIRTIAQYKTDLDALESSATSAVDDLASVEESINGSGGLASQVSDLESDLSTIDSTLSGYVSDALSYRNSALTYRNTAEDHMDDALAYKNTTYGYRQDVSGWYGTISGWKTAAEDARDLSEQYRDEAEAFKNQAGQIAGGDFVTKSTTVNGKALTNNITINPSDLGLDNVDNTSDANKPISTATQAAFDALETSIALPTLQARLDEIEILALAGL